MREGSARAACAMLTGTRRGDATMMGTHGSDTMAGGLVTGVRSDLR